MNQYFLHKSYNLILIRYTGEIWLKSQKVKMRMIKILTNNIQKMLDREGIPYTKYQITKDSARILFFFKHKDLVNAIEVIKKAFGIYSLSPALRTSKRIKNISERAIEIGEKIFKKDDSFALRVKRAGKHDFTSQDIANQVGQDIMDYFSYLNLSVNLNNPDKKIFIEVRNEFSYLFTDIFETPWEGLPIEYKKKVGVMDVGRQSDLLAGVLLMRRGCEIFPILFNLTDKKDVEEKWISNWKEVFQYTPFSKFTLIKINLNPILEVIKQKIDKNEYFCVICRLVRFHIIAKIIDKSQNGIHDIQAFTDGLNFNNLDFCTDDVDLYSISLNHLFSNLPIFTPLVGFDNNIILNDLEKISNRISKINYCKYKPKNQIIDYKIARKIYESLNIEDLIQDVIDKSKEHILS